MAKKSFTVGTLVLFLVFGFWLMGCATAASSVKGTRTVINTVSGYSYPALIIAKNMWEGIEIARGDDGIFLLYANCITNGRADPGSLWVLVDNKRFDLVDPFPRGWSISDVSVSQYGTAKYWSAHNPLDKNLIEALRDAQSIVFKAVNTNAYLSLDGIDASSIVPQIKEFLGN